MLKCGGTTCFVLSWTSIEHSVEPNVVIITLSHCASILALEKVTQVGTNAWNSWKNRTKDNRMRKVQEFNVVSQAYGLQSPEPKGQQFFWKISKGYIFFL